MRPLSCILAAVVIGLSVFLIWLFVMPRFPDERVDVLRMEIIQLASAMREYKNIHGEFPPCMTPDDPKRKEKLIRHFGKAFPRREFKDRLPSNLQLKNLDSAEALVFFLGGLPSPDLPRRCLGFSSDPKDPFGCQQKSGIKYRGPYYNFDNRRLTDRDGDGFWEYAPIQIQTPFVYFDSSSYGLTYVDPSNLESGTAVAYQETKGQWYAPEEFQIISAGIDDKFGTTATRVVCTGEGITTEDKDNYTSFTQGPISEEKKSGSSSNDLP